MDDLPLPYPTFTEYDARLSPDEYSASLECGCVLSAIPDGSVILQFCAMHKKAGKTLNAAEAIDGPPTGAIATLTIVDDH